MSGNVLMDISVMAEEVIGPLLCNPENQKGWPKIVQQDMKRHVDDLRNLMHQASTSHPYYEVSNFIDHSSESSGKCLPKMVLLLIEIILPLFRLNTP